MTKHYRMRELQNMPAGLTDWHEIFMHMGAFGAQTVKPTRLYSNRGWIKDMALTVPAEYKGNPELETVTRSSSGAITGGKDLKDTQAYPDGYGKALLAAWKRGDSKNVLPPVHPDDELSEDSDNFEEDTWSDAQLGNMLCSLNICEDRMPF